MRYLEFAPDGLLLPNIAVAISRLPSDEVTDFFEALFFEDVARSEAQQARVREILRSVGCADALVRTTKKLRTQVLNLEFPPAPFASTAPLFPITSSRELAEEAERMNNCVRSFVEDVARGSMYFYRWREEAAVTLALERNDGVWVLSDVRCAKNENVPVVVLQRMLDCLDPDEI